MFPRILSLLSLDRIYSSRTFVHIFLGSILGSLLLLAVGSPSIQQNRPQPGLAIPVQGYLAELNLRLLGTMPDLNEWQQVTSSFRGEGCNSRSLSDYVTLLASRSHDEEVSTPEGRRRVCDILGIKSEACFLPNGVISDDRARELCEGRYSLPNFLPLPQQISQFVMTSEELESHLKFVPAGETLYLEPSTYIYVSRKGLTIPANVHLATRGLPERDNFLQMATIILANRSADSLLALMPGASLTNMRVVAPYCRSNNNCDHPSVIELEGRNVVSKMHLENVSLRVRDISSDYLSKVDNNLFMSFSSKPTADLTGVMDEATNRISASENLIVKGMGTEVTLQHSPRTPSPLSGRNVFTLMSHSSSS